ncbi:MAG TPA: hypothetical protein VF691_06395, partial [Cytophagaceae bacterium]
SMWPPFEFDITPFATAGKNTLQVSVGNLFLNQMRTIDNMSTNRLGKSKVVWPRGKPLWNEYDAGISGPVKLRIER